MKHGSGCPIAKTAELLSDTWTMLILRDVLRGTQRFNDLERSLEGISTRTLTLKLKNLSQCGMLRKQRDGSYAPTSKAKPLKPVIEAMEKYGRRFL